ncbi:hypothetical protein LH51_02240 [Nitrincola sp. A-D6]|uniref:DUF6134 family protein n=1 Tax=Nitrincola sp. A-D6 TaxID=1545442 RepID=UPI00051FBC70|nr:DUF6134 family protein [Nitrincola sp. A-D6]KGK43135.1 hypothetical protein LH51_02240 [Nitrincola sp. A-D6]
MFKLTLVTLFTAGLLGTSSLQANQSESKTPDQVMHLYGDTLVFDVLRSGRTIGTHRLDFSEEQGMLRVDVEMDLNIRFMALFSYQYRYLASEWWSNGQLQRLDVRIDDDGDLTELSAQREGDYIHLVQGSQSRQIPAELLTTNHWNVALLSQSAVLNTLTGEISQLAVEFLGDATAPAGGKEVPVRQYRLGGELEDTDTWYDDQGRWLGMEFSARDDSRIRLINRTIGGQGE